jgi:hypothetical protein
VRLIKIRIASYISRGMHIGAYLCFSWEMYRMRKEALQYSYIYFGNVDISLLIIRVSGIDISVASQSEIDFISVALNGIVTQFDAD